jgi:acetoin utilization deacetylase AcuC-like enzyme
MWRDGLINAARLALSRAGTTLRDLGVPLPTAARLVYHPDYSTTPRDAGARHDFDVRRPTRIIDQLYKAGLLSDAQVTTPQPATREQLELVHTAGYLDEIYEPGRLAQLLFMPRDVLRDNALLQSFLLQTGGTIRAAVSAVHERIPVFNLGGGFHHAQRDRAEGLCAINDVAVATRVLQRHHLAHDVLVIDLDYHPGNGTALVFSEDESVFTLSLHGQSWARVEGKRNNLDVELPPETGDEAYMVILRRALEEVLGRFTPQAAIYLAGADPHEEDALGDLAMTEDGMLDRDLHVWGTLQEAQIPFAVVLGGGYSPFAWTIAYNFICSALSGTRIPAAFRPSNIEARYRRVKASLSPADLRLGDDELTEQDLTDEITGQCTRGRRGSRLFLNTYTAEGLQLALERYGFLDLIRERGFDDLRVCINADDPERQILRIHYEQQTPEHMLVEVVARFRTLVTPAPARVEGAQETYRMLSIEWLLMQDPRGSFTLARQRMPGQKHPGLGIGRWMVELLRMMSERVECDGLMNIPEHYHNAYFYSKQMLFFSPYDQGTFEAMKRDLRGLPLVETSGAIDDGLLRALHPPRRATELVRWEGRPQVMPTKRSLNAYFARQSYIRAVGKAREAVRFWLASPAAVGLGR